MLCLRASSTILTSCFGTHLNDKISFSKDECFASALVNSTSSLERDFDEEDNKDAQSTRSLVSVGSFAVNRKIDCSVSSRMLWSDSIDFKSDVAFEEPEESVEYDELLDDERVVLENSLILIACRSCSGAIWRRKRRAGWKLRVASLSVFVFFNNSDVTDQNDLIRFIRVPCWLVST